MKTADFIFKTLLVILIVSVVLNLLIATSVIFNWWNL
jgi:hypothetical protein